MVIGRRCKNVPNDKSAVLDVTHGPIGPWIVTPDEVGDPLDLGLRTYVNDDLRQDGRTGDMIFNSYEHPAYPSRFA